MLREKVIIKTATTNIEGELFVGADGLPELVIGVWDREFYRPWTLPAAWTVCYRSDNQSDILLYTWIRISDLRQDIRDAQREADENARREPDCDITAYKRRADAEGER